MRILALAALTGVVLSLSGPARAEFWYTETVEETYDPLGASLALDAQGNPHMSYVRDQTWVIHAYREGLVGPWTLEVVDSIGAYIPDFTTPIAVDGTNIHIAYATSRFDSTDALKYALKSGGVWSIETVDPGSGALVSPSLRLDGNGNPHISYLGPRNPGCPCGTCGCSLKYAFKSSGVWHTEGVRDSTGSWIEGPASSLALGGGVPPSVHIATFSVFPPFPIRYAHRIADSLWTIEQLPGDGAMQVALALDSSGSPHLAWSPGTGVVRYARRNGAAWMFEDFGNGSASSSGISMVLDGSDTPHVCYSSGTGVKYAVREGTWSIETVDVAGSGGSSYPITLAPKQANV